MDITSILGVLGGAAVIAGSIMVAGASFKAFIDAPSIVCVLGGAVMALCTAFTLKEILALPMVLKKAILPGVPDIEPVIKQVVEFAEIARRDGILALESRMDGVKDPFVKIGMQMAIDGIDSASTEAILRTDVETMAGRHKTGKAMFDAVVKYAPAWGMIGTLIGLVIMLGNMSDPNAIGPGMAVALLTTLYGAIMANLAFGPLGDKIASYSKKEIAVREIIIRGILAIQAGDNPRVLEQKLRTFLPPGRRKAA